MKSQGWQVVPSNDDLFNPWSNIAFNAGHSLQNKEFVFKIGQNN